MFTEELYKNYKKIQDLSPIEIDEDDFYRFIERKLDDSKPIKIEAGALLTFYYRRLELMTGSGPNAMYQDEGYFVEIDIVKRPRVIDLPNILKEQTEEMFFVRLI